MVEKAASRPWTSEEDVLLKRAIQIHGTSDNWKAVAQEVPGRNNKACRKRWLHSLSPAIKKTPWTPPEDDRLITLYNIHGPKWSFIARQIPGRTDDACSKRYNEALNPNLKKHDWTPEEDDLLIQVHTEIGDNRWKEVGIRLQRSGLACRNRWHMLERKGKITSSSYPGTSRFVSQPQSFCYPYYPPESYPLYEEGATGTFRDLTPETSQSTMNTAATFTYPPFQFSSSSLSAALSIPAQTLSPSSPCSFLDLPIDSPYNNSPVTQPSPILSPYVIGPSVDIPRMSEAETAILLDNFSVSTPSTYNSHPISYVNEAPYIPHESGISTGQNGPNSPSGYSFSHNDLSKSPQVLLEHISSYSYDRQAGSPFSDNSPETNASEMPSASCSPLVSISSFSPSTSPPSAAMSIDLPENDPPPHDSLLFSETVTPVTALTPRQEVTNIPKKLTNTTRLSTVMPFGSDGSLRPYACGHQDCWPATENTSRACFATSKELWDHNRATHVDDFNDDRPFRCALPGCGKAWKSLNGIQYHLQVSAAHFQQAVSSSFSSGAHEGESPRLESESRLESGSQDETRRFACDHPHCFKSYKTASGLRYHRKHGHPKKLPMQLTDMPPALARDLPLRVRKMRKKDDPQQVQNPDVVAPL